MALKKTVELDRIVSSVNCQEPSEYSDNKIKKINKINLSNFFELFYTLTDRQSTSEVINNIFAVAFTNPLIELTGKKSVKNQHEISFQVKFANFLLIDKKLNNKSKNVEIKKILSNQNITTKSHDYLFSLIEKDIKVFQKEMSHLCLIIILSSMQDKKSFKSLVKQFQKIMKPSLFLRRISRELKPEYLQKLKPLIKSHSLSPAFGYAVIEALINYRKNKKIDVDRQYSFAVLIKNLFYFKSDPIVEFMDVVYSNLNGPLFWACLKVLFDQNSEDEIETWLTLLNKCYCEGIQFKKRLILAFRLLYTANQKPDKDLNLESNKRTYSFFIGFLTKVDKFEKKIEMDQNLLIDFYYALGIQFRNLLILQQIQANFEFCVKNKVLVPRSYIEDCLRWLKESAQYVDLYRSGLEQIMDIYGKDTKQDPFRHALTKVDDQIQLLNKIYNTSEYDTKRRNNYIVNFLDDQADMMVIYDKTDENENLKIYVSENEKKSYSSMDYSQATTNLGNQSNVLNDISNNVKSTTDLPKHSTPRHVSKRPRDETQEAISVLDAKYSIKKPKLEQKTDDEIFDAAVGQYLAMHTDDESGFQSNSINNQSTGQLSDQTNQSKGSSFYDCIELD